MNLAQNSKEFCRDSSKKLQTQKYACNEIDFGVQ